jgi:hypothetical protein
MTQNDGKIFVIETISMFKMTYYVRARCETDAKDEVCCNKDNDSFIEGSQRHVDEIQINARELTEDEFIKEFDKENEYLSGCPRETKLARINEINYAK